MRGCVMRVWRRYLDDKPWRILLRKVTTSSNLPNHQHGHPVLPGAEAVNSTYRPVDANDAAGYWPGSSVSHNVSVTRLAAAPTPGRNTGPTVMDQCGTTRPPMSTVTVHQAVALPS